MGYRSNTEVQDRNENGEVRAETFMGKDNGVMQLYDGEGLRVQLAATSNMGSVLGSEIKKET